MRSGIVEIFRGLSTLIESSYYRYLRLPIYVAVVVLHLLDATATPPERYPYLIQLLFSVLAFFLFCVVFLYSNLTMLVAAHDRTVQVISKSLKAE